VTEQNRGAHLRAQGILEAAEHAMGTVEARARIHSVSAVAACRGPNFEYETRIVSDRMGNLSLQQILPNRKNIAGIAEGRGWGLNPEGRPEPIDTVETLNLRLHEFPLLALDLAKRFREFRTVGYRKIDGVPTDHLSMVDDLGSPASAFLSTTTHLPVGLTTTNPRSEGPPTLETRFDGWRLLEGVYLVSHVTLGSAADRWTFDFRTLEINTAEPEVFGIPGDLSP